MKEKNEPYAFVIKKILLSEYKLNNKLVSNLVMTREEAIEILVSKIKEIL